MLLRVHLGNEDISPASTDRVTESVQPVWNMQILWQVIRVKRVKDVICAYTLGEFLRYDLMTRLEPQLSFALYMKALYLTSR
jgi:hypothetical protein